MSSMKNKNPPNRGKQNLRFNGIRDPVVTDASVTTPTMVTPVADGSGNYSIAIPFSPIGMSGGQVASTTSTGATFTANSNTVPAKLPFLWNQSRNFERYRVTRAVLIFVGNVGSTTVGRITLGSSTDYSDMFTTQLISQSVGDKTFDLASSASRELRFQMDVDSSWKKISNTLFNFPFSNSVIVPVNTANDLCFSIGFLTITGSTQTASAAIGNLFVEYDVEFKDPISFSVNA